LPDVIAAQELRLRQLGVSAAFAKRATTAPPQDMWVPSTQELVAEKVVTKVVNPANYAFSGLGLSDLTSATVDDFLRGIEIYAVINRVDPNAYEEMKEELLLGLRQGKTTGAVRANIAPIAEKVYMNALSQASPDTLVEYARLTAWQLNFLKQRSAKECYIYANPEKGLDITIEDVISKYPLLDEKESAFRLKVLKAYHPTEFAVQDKKYTDAVLARLFSALKSRFGADAELIANDQIPPEKYFAYCTVLASFYDEIGRLPTSTGAGALRGLLARR
jgi:hypothetical protein